MNKLLWITYNGQTVEVVASKITLPKLKRFVEVIEVEEVKTRPLSFRVIADKYLCHWLNLPYKDLQVAIS